MPGVVEDAPTAGGHQDEIDDLFDYDVSAEDLLRAANEQAERRVGAQKNAQSKPADLGLDEEIKVEKKRAPVAKLDTER
jgi:replication fork protection complex subunit Csm3/Swi3